MTDTEWLARLDADFGKLQRNRQQVPLEKLETTYAKSYKALIGRLTEAADWFADRYLQTLTEHWPRHPKDTAGNEWLERKVAAIIEEENQAGGLPGQMEAGPGGPPRPGGIRAAGLRAIRPVRAGSLRPLLAAPQPLDGRARETAGSTTTSSAGFGSRRGETRTSPTEPGSTATTRFTPAAGHRPLEKT